MDDQTQFINVVFDPNFTSFEQDLQSMSMEKMMSIQFSEEILQKNFTVLINILKQLHKGMINITGDVKDNKDWVLKLREITQTGETDKRLDALEAQLKEFATKDELHGVKQRFDNILKDQEQQIIEIEKKVGDHDTSIQQNTANVAQHQLEINRINDELAKLRGIIDEHGAKMDQIFIRLDSQPKPQTPYAAPLTIETQAPMDNEQLRQLMAKVNMFETQQQDMQKQIDQLGLGGGGGETDLSEINKRLIEHSEDIVKIYDMLDSLKSKLKDTQPAGEGTVIGEEEVQLIKNDIKKLFVLIEQLQTQLNLASMMGGGKEGADVGENQMAIILAEINKVRALLQDYVTQGDLANELIKVNSKFKQCNDHTDEEIEKVRREFKLKLDKKGEQADIKKVADDMAALRALLGNKRGSQANIIDLGTPLNNKSVPAIDPDFMNNFKELQELVNQIEHDLLNHKSTNSQFQVQTNTKIHDLEKKLQGFQTDKIYNELQALRELCDQLKKESDSNKNKIKEFKSKIEQFLTKDEMMAILEPKLKAQRDELIKLIEELKNRLDKKADLEDLTKVQDNLLTKLEEVVQALIKQLANKQETKKALIYLEQKINQIFMILEGDGGSKDAEGLFAKRPLLWSCASCDKDLDKFKGQLGDYKGWAVFPPKETSPERMGRFGVGYKNQQDKQKVQRDKLDKERQQANTDKDRPNTNSQTQQGFYGQTMSQSQTNLPKINPKG